MPGLRDCQRASAVHAKLQRLRLLAGPIFHGGQLWVSLDQKLRQRPQERQQRPLLWSIKL